MQPLPDIDTLADSLLKHTFEVEGVSQKDGDTVIDGDVLANRAHDLLCHRGLAREISVLHGLKLTEQKTYTGETSPATLNINNNEPELCRRYTGRKISGLTIGESPVWLRERLNAIDARSINSVVDATNYVMYDLNQPLHAFDAAKVSGSIVIRKSVAGESITLLTGETIDLPLGTLLIADEEKPLAIAGVKGGKAAEVTSETTDIILEAANFDGVMVRRTSRGLKLITDSAKRFENGITHELTIEAMDEVTAYIVELCGGTQTVVEEIVDVHLTPESRLEVTLKHSDIALVLGRDVTEDEAGKILTTLGCTVSWKDGVASVMPPIYRLDLTLAEDLIEEIARIVGYETIPSILPQKENVAEVNPEVYVSMQIKKYLVEQGFSEVSLYAFANKGDIEVENPVAKDKAFLRSDLETGVVESIRKNISHTALLGEDMLKMFEIGKVFKGGEEKLALCVAVKNTQKKPNAKDVVVEVVQQIVADIFKMSSPNVGEFKEIKLTEGNEYWYEIIVPSIEVEKGVTYDSLLVPSSTHIFSPISPYPCITRDIAVWMPEAIPATELSELIKEKAGPLLVTEPRLVDTYSKGGRTSNAFRLVFQSFEKTLSDEEVNTIMETVYEAVKGKGWEVR